MKRVFLGGTCNNSKWRDNLIKLLDDSKISYFNPVVDNWTEECMKTEIMERKKCDYVLYVITPLMTGVYSIAEVVDDSNKKPKNTLFCVLEKDDNKSFDKHQMKSLNQVSKMVVTNGGKVFNDLDSIANFLNSGKSFKDIKIV